MSSLHNAHSLARCVLVWWMLFMGASVASPWVKPETSQLVCTATGSIKMVQVGADDASAPLTHAWLDCPACLPLMGPAAALAVTEWSWGAAPHVLPSPSTARLASRPQQPWQARAPPAFGA